MELDRESTSEGFHPNLTRASEAIRCSDARRQPHIETPPPPQYSVH